MSQERGITGLLAIRILDKAIEKCRNTLSTLEMGTEDFESVYMEMRMYQMHKETLLKGGDINDF